MTNTNSEVASSDAVRECSAYRKAAYDLTKSNDLMRLIVLDCISIMRSHPKDLEVQNSGTLALAALCEKRSLEEFVGERGGMEALLLSLDRFQNNEGIVKNTLVLFRSLFGCAHNRQRFRIHGGLTLLVTVMKAHPKRAGIQRVCCFLVFVLSSDPDVVRFRIAESGVVPLIMNALRRFDSAKHGRMHLYACKAFRNLTNDQSQCEQVVEADWSLSGVGHVLRKTADLEVVHSALCVFRNVTTHQAVVSFRPVTERQITGALVSFLNRSSHLPVKYCGCHEECFALLRSRLLSEDSIIPHDYFLRLCLSYTGTYLQTEEIQSHSVVGHACACIRMMLFADWSRVDFRSIPNSIETLVQAVNALSFRPIRLEQALLALGNAVFDSTEAQERVQARNGIRVIAEAMKKNTFSAVVTIAGLQAMHAICANNPCSVEKATSLSMQTLCVKMLDVFKDNPHVQESGLATIATLGITENGSKALQDSSALKAARRAARHFPFSQKILLLTKHVQSLVDKDSTLSDDDGNTGDNVRRQNIASRLLRKFSSRPTPSD